MYSYFAYGLGIHSEVELPELAPAPARGEIVVRFAAREIFSAREESENGVFVATRDEARVRYDGVAAFRICGGSEIEIEPHPQAHAREWRLALLGPALAALLHQRGCLVLHASAVAMGSRALAFAAPPGGGKSTAAVALTARGFRLVTDDILAIGFDAANAPLVYPAYPFLKISPDAARALGQDARAAPRVHTQLDKRVWRVSAFESAPVSLACIYVLVRGDNLAIEPMTTQGSFIALVGHTFVAPLLEPTNSTQDHFRQCATLGTQVPVRRLTVPASLQALPRLADLVRADARGFGL